MNTLTRHFLGNSLGYRAYRKLNIMGESLANHVGECIDDTISCLADLETSFRVALLKASRAGLSPERWTDYPVEEFGDVPGETAPMRLCLVHRYDGDKYCQVTVFDGERESSLQEIKAGYIYERVEPGIL